MPERAEQEIREDFQSWFKAAAAKDTDAVMSHIAKDALSYEHDAPLQYKGEAAIREVCQRGFDAMEGAFRWDIPDLNIIVRDDIAVSWGLNHMTAKGPAGKVIDMWSRGTRVHQKIGDRWLMIHQHVSYPYDPETGAAKLDLKP
jgi:ketosteroid isomerase-like protein